MWPYDQSKPGIKIKPRGFWQDPRTIKVLRDLKNNTISNNEAVQKLRCMPDDPRWYIKRYDKKGWPKK